MHEVRPVPAPCACAAALRGGQRWVTLAASDASKESRAAPLYSMMLDLDLEVLALTRLHLTPRSHNIYLSSDMDQRNFIFRPAFKDIY